MDPTPPLSRDPRLNRPSLSTRLSEHGEVPHRLPAGPRQPSVSDLQNDVSCDEFIRGIADLMRLVFYENTNKSKKAEIQKKRSETEEMLRRAKALSAFPATLEGLEHTRTEGNRALVEIDDKIKNQDTQRQRLLAQLGNIWAAVANSKSSQAEDQVLQLQQSLKSANDKISSLHGDIAGLVNRNKVIDNQLSDVLKRLDAQQERINAQKKSLGGYTNSWALVNNDVDKMKKDLDPLKKGLDECAIRVKHLEEKRTQPVNGINADTRKALDEFSVQVKTLEQKAAGFAEQIGSLSSSYQRISDLPNQVNGKLNEQQQKLRQFAGSTTTNPRLAKVENDVLSINERFKELQDIWSTKDILQFAQIEEVQEKLKQTQQDHDRLDETMKETLLRTPKEPIDTKVNGLLAQVRELNDQIAQIEIVNMAIQSLEVRYNNVTTDGLAQHMLGAMRELYPTPDRILEDLTGHRQQLQMLRQKTEQLETQVKVPTVPPKDLQTIKSEQEDLRRALGDVLQRYEGVDQQQIQLMQTRLESLAENQQTNNIALQQKQIEGEEVLQEMKNERESIKDRLTSLQGDLEKLNSECAQPKPNAVSEEDMRSLEGRITALEASTTQGYDKLKSQIDRLKKTVRAQDAPSERTSQQPDSTSGIQPPPPPPRPDLIDGNLGMRIKRQYPSDDERSPAPNSPRSPNSTATSALTQSELRERKKNKKKNKKRRLEGQAQTQRQLLTQTPIEIDD
ncbi:uncharacterized protein BDV17DRAFT_78274 [Aspergillus undulatus]|uniref:uncharacterized protein n=1 Tax=Aspergillus undulatus TaxID=1810928 RepID=UPI003CCD5BA8